MKIYEVLEVLDVITTYYPNFLKVEDLQRTAKAWHTFLEEMDQAEVLRNLHEHIKTDRFPPTVADLIKFEETEHSRRAIPNNQETLLMLAAPFENKQAATEEERKEGLKAIQEVLKELNK